MALAWLTPENIGDGQVCYTIVLPKQRDIEAAFLGSLFLLSLESNWEKFGALDPADVADVFKQIVNDFIAMEGNMCLLEKREVIEWTHSELTTSANGKFPVPPEWPAKTLSLIWRNVLNQAVVVSLYMYDPYGGGWLVNNEEISAGNGFFKMIPSAGGIQSINNGVALPELWYPASSEIGGVPKYQIAVAPLVDPTSGSIRCELIWR